MTPVPSGILIMDSTLKPKDVERIKAAISKMFPGSNVTVSFEKPQG